MGSSSSKAAAAGRRPRSDSSRSRSSSSCLGGLRSFESDHHLFLEEEGDVSISNHNKEENVNYGDDRPTTIEEEEEEEEEDDENNKQGSSLCCNDEDHFSSTSTSLRSRFSFNFKLTRASSLGSSSAPAPQDNRLISNHPSTNHNSQFTAPQPVDRSIRFSRALSVGRLRDRVLRRSSLADGLFAQDRQLGGGFSRTQPNVSPLPSPSPSPSPHPLSTLSNSMHNNQDDQLETPPPREARYHDLMEHRTDFLERRRRIRSQVRALQRLGSRFENLSGHERSCILAGQHRSGLCTCRTSNRARNPDDNTSARASISRIVMLAEALFEVLDEIHQQSVVLSSRPSVSSLGSIPAPKEVVESLPVKIYTKLRKHQIEDVPQCYICLVEYEEGDSMRILPCHHEFHRPCIDKWLKEIHRVCPLCRGDVCRSE